jgi:hypothetical protein
VVNRPERLRFDHSTVAVAMAKHGSVWGQIAWEKSIYRGLQSTRRQGGLWPLGPACSAAWAQRWVGQGGPAMWFRPVAKIEKNSIVQTFLVFCKLI